MAFAPSRSKKHKTVINEELNLTSMMDAMTIILLFLLKTFSTSEAIMTNTSDLTLPYSISTLEPHKELTVSITKNSILVADKPVLDLNNFDPNSNTIIPLFEELRRKAAEARKNEAELGLEFTQEVIVMADETTPYQQLFNVIYTCGSSEYNKLRLLTIRER